MRSFRLFPAVLLAVVLSALAGGLFGSSLLARQDDLQQEYKIFTAALTASSSSSTRAARSRRVSSAFGSGAERNVSMRLSTG